MSGIPAASQEHPPNRHYFGDTAPVRFDDNVGIVLVFRETPGSIQISPLATLALSARQSRGRGGEQGREQVRRDRHRWRSLSRHSRIRGTAASVLPPREKTEVACGSSAEAVVVDREVPASTSPPSRPISRFSTPGKDPAVAAFNVSAEGGRRCRCGVLSSRRAAPVSPVGPPRPPVSEPLVCTALAPLHCPRLPRLSLLKQLSATDRGTAAPAAVELKCGKDGDDSRSRNCAAAAS